MSPDARQSAKRLQIPGDVCHGFRSALVSTLVVEHNYVRREHTTTKSKKPVAWTCHAFLKGKNNIADEFVFLSPDVAILNPDNLYHRYFQPVLTKAGLRKIRFHDLRHTFGSLLIQSGASIV